MDFFLQIFYTKTQDAKGVTGLLIMPKLLILYDAVRDFLRAWAYSGK
jgi:hypothetical protein